MLCAVKSCLLPGENGNSLSASCPSLQLDRKQLGRRNLLSSKPSSRPRYPIILKNGALSGTGATLLNDAIRPARFVMLGEDHFTREIPPLAEALCDIIHPDAYAVEVGPYMRAKQHTRGILRHSRQLCHERRPNILHLVSRKHFRVHLRPVRHRHIPEEFLHLPRGSKCNQHMRRFLAQPRESVGNPARPQDRFA